MRALVVAGLVVFHSAVVFAAGASWFVKDPRPSIGFTVFLVWGSLWGMPLLFVVSGMGVRYAMRTRPAGAFARERLARLGVPFAAGLVVAMMTPLPCGRITRAACFMLTNTPRRSIAQVASTSAIRAVWIGP